MHFHLPKPLHGWREFVGEVGIIVLGVLIALAAEQVVQNFRDHRVATQTRDSVTDEIDNDLTALQLRKSAEPCIGRGPGELHALVEEWSGKRCNAQQTSITTVIGANGLATDA
jgi:hypothetical protein